NMPPTFFWLLLLFVFLATAKYTLGPILVRFKTSASANPSFDEIPDEHARALFPPNFFSTIYELEQLGFSVACHLSSATTVGRAHMVLSLLVNRDAQTMSVIGFARSLRPETFHMTVNFLEFSSHFEDGSELDTSNSSTVKVF